MFFINKKIISVVNSDDKSFSRSFEMPWYVSLFIKCGCLPFPMLYAGLSVSDGYDESNIQTRKVLADSGTLATVSPTADPKYHGIDMKSIRGLLLRARSCGDQTERLDAASATLASDSINDFRVELPRGAGIRIFDCELGLTEEQSSGFHDFVTGKGDSFQIEKFTGYIGEGATSEVYVALASNDKKYVVKCFNGDGTLARDSEYHLHRGLNHPNIVKLVTWVDFIDSTGQERKGLVLELCQSSLKNISYKSGPYKKMHDLLVESVRAVMHMHSVGVYHRDLKPDNIFLTSGVFEDTHVRIGDFGASTRDTSDTSLTNITPEYLPVEIIRRGTPQNLAARDWWALGVSFFKQLTKKFPFEYLGVDLLGSRRDTFQLTLPLKYSKVGTSNLLDAEALKRFSRSRSINMLRPFFEMDPEKRIQAVNMFFALH